MSTSQLFWTVAVFVLLLTSPSHGATSTKQRREVITAKHGAVAADDGRCSIIGTKVLKAGGHAVDAAVAVALCLGVVSPASSGIGGGAFMIIRQANGKVQALDMRETAPSKASQDMYGGNATLKESGALSIAVPGELAGLYRAWKEHGKLPWKRLVAPAEYLARRGFLISPYLTMQLDASRSAIFADKGLRDIFTSEGKLLRTGDICRNKKLADTLRKIALFGIDAFYKGSIGVNLVKDVQKAGGILTISDMKNYQVKIRKPISTKVFGLEIISMPPPSSGGASMTLMLNILAQYGIPFGSSDDLRVHRTIEALKHAFAVRMNLGDPDFVDITKVVEDMLSPDFAKELKQTIDDNKTFNSSYYGGRWNQILDHGTSHVSIVDAEGNAVSMTNTVNAYFGSKMLSPSTGIILNNEMDDFSIPRNTSGDVPPPAPANFIRPGKTPLSSMTPTIVLKDKKLKGVVGASGGANIIAGTTEVLLNHFALGMDPLSSVMAPRFYHQLIPNRVIYENWTTVIGDHFEVPVDIRASLQRKGHALQSLAGGTVCQFIVQEFENSHGKLVAVSDPRKGGFPAGF